MKTQITRLLAFVMVILMSMLSAGCEEDSKERYTRPFELGIYSEFVDYATVRSHLLMLEEYNVILDLAIPEEKMGNPELATLIKEANNLDIDLRAWLLLSHDKGYWPNEDNLEEYEKLVNEFFNWLESIGLHVGWLMVDMEPSIFLFEETEQSTSGMVDIFDILVENIDPEKYQQSVDGFQGLVDSMHIRDVKVMVGTFPFVLDDPEDGDYEISDAMNLPIFGVDWDEVSFGVYLNFLEQYMGITPTDWIIYDYAKDAKAYFGDKAGIVLGVIGDVGIGVEEGFYQEPDELRSSIAASLAAGVSKIHLYSLDGVIAHSMPEEWLKYADVLPEVPTVDTATDSIRILLKQLDERGLGMLEK